MSLHFTAHLSIKSIQQEWDELIPADHPLQSQNLLVLEDSKIGDFAFHYLLVRKESGESVAAIYFQQLQFYQKHYRSPFSDGSLMHSVENFIVKKGFQILCCGNLFRIDFPGIYYKEELTTLADVLNCIRQFSEDITPSPHALMLKDCKKEWNNTLVHDYGFQLWEEDLTMKMDLDSRWKSMDDYVLALKRKYGQRFRKARKMLEGVIRKELSFEELEKYKAQLSQLYMNVVNRQTIRLGIAGSNYFGAHQQILKERFIVYGYFLQNELVAFASYIKYNQLLESHFIGINYEYNERYWLYFNILFDSIKDAIHLRKDELEFGRTARLAKANVGCRPVYFQNYVRYKNRGIRFIVSFLQKQFITSVGSEWNTAHPYKKKSDDPQPIIGLNQIDL